MSATRGVIAAGSGSAWDHRRNTSGRHEPDPRALGEALRVCAELRRSDPRLVKWIEDGHPQLSETEHVRRFGAPYRSRAQAARTA